MADIVPQSQKTLSLPTLLRVLSEDIHLIQVPINDRSMASGIQITRNSSVAAIFLRLKQTRELSCLPVT